MERMGAGKTHGKFLRFEIFCANGTASHRWRSQLAERNSRNIFDKIFFRWARLRPRGAVESLEQLAEFLDPADGGPAKGLWEKRHQGVSGEGVGDAESD